MSRDLMLNVAAFTLQVGVIATAAALLLQVLRIASAGTRYLCWRVVLAACLVMPLVLQRPPAAGSSELPSDEPAVAVALLDSEVVSDETALSSAPGPGIPWPLVAALVIGVGGCARAAWLAVGLIRLRGLRRRGIAVEDAAYDEIQSTLGTAATLRCVDGLTQPATFGVWRPVVLLPETLAEQPAALRRAVVTHELFHVQRRDWLWVLAEESVRTVLWFHPAILWLTSRIQLAREELVDELTVLATGNRRAYIEALMTFADAGPARPAPAFARRRQLFTRIVRLSKEGVMSSPRIVVSAGFVIAAVLGTAWYASHAFPIVSAEGTQSLAAPVTVEHVSDQAPAPAVVEPPAVASWTRVAQGPRSGGAPRPGPTPVVATPAGTKPITPENPIPRRLSTVAVPYPSQLRGSGYRGVVTLQATLDSSGAISAVRQIGVEVGGGDPADQSARVQAGEAFSNTAAAAVRQWRYQSPADPPIAFLVTARFDGEADAIATQSDGSTAAGRTVFATFGTTGRGNELAEFERRLSTLREEQSRAAAQFGGQDPRVLELNKQLEAMERELERARELEKRVAVAVVEPGPGGAARRVTGPGATAQSPVRVGGNIRPPTKTRHVNPVYPEIAKSARVQGVVIMDVTIDEQGRVAEARVLRSIPLLDQAALDAVQQWEFTPTLLNGAPAPIVMTVTVQFSLPEAQPLF